MGFSIVEGEPGPPGRFTLSSYILNSDGDVGEDDGGVGVDCGDDDVPRQRSSATESKGERAPLLLLLP